MLLLLRCIPCLALLVLLPGCGDPPPAPVASPSAPVSGQSAPVVVPPKAPSVSPPAATDPDAVALAITRRATLEDFPEWLKAHAPMRTHIRSLTDISPPGFPSDKIRYRLSADMGAGETETFEELLRSQTDIQDVEVLPVSQDSEFDIIIEFTIRLDPSH